jgi:hypothetical protein
MLGAPVEKLKLFVVGESSPNPDDWDSGWGSPRKAIVIAHDETEAAKLADEISGPITEIPMTSPVVLMHESLRGDGL